jgi:putative membrane protein
MENTVKQNPPADLRDYLAEERTFLAWIRTGIALMGFGFVLAHFGIFPEEHSSIRYGSGLVPHELSGWLGAALIAVGVTVNLFSAWRYMRLVGELNRGQFVQRSVSKHGVIVAMFLALLGTAITIYIALLLPDPANLLQV